MKIAISRVHFPVTTLGPGRRVGIWTQGCSVGCTGCVSQDTWAATTAHHLEIDEVVSTVSSLVAQQPVDGITISGGEPSDQAPAVEELVHELRGWGASEGRELDVLLYSGRSAAWLTSNAPALLATVDALIPEPFLQHRPSGGRWRGSSNQPIIPLSDLGRARYPAQVVDATDSTSLQVAVEDGVVWLIGIPRRGDLDALVQRAAARGVEIREPSWRA